MTEEALRLFLLYAFIHSPVTSHAMVLIGILTLSEYLPVRLPAVAVSVRIERLQTGLKYSNVAFEQMTNHVIVSITRLGLKMGHRLVWVDCSFMENSWTFGDLISDGESD